MTISYYHWLLQFTKLFFKKASLNVFKWLHIKASLERKDSSIPNNTQGIFKFCQKYFVIFSTPDLSAQNPGTKCRWVHRRNMDFWCLGLLKERRGWESPKQILQRSKILLIYVTVSREQVSQPILHIIDSILNLNLVENANEKGLYFHFSDVSCLTLCTGSFYASTWLGHKVPRCVVKH